MTLSAAVYLVIFFLPSGLDSKRRRHERFIHPSEIIWHENIPTTRLIGAISITTVQKSLSANVAALGAAAVLESG